MTFYTFAAKSVTAAVHNVRTLVFQVVIIQAQGTLQVVVHIL